MREDETTDYGESLKRLFLGCENAAGKLSQKGSATAGTKFTKPGNGLVEIPCIYTIEDVKLFWHLDHMNFSD